MTRVEQHTFHAVVHGLAIAAEITCAVITCDGCGARHVVADCRGIDSATADAARHGWTWDEGECDGCPAHPVGRAR